MTEAATSEEGGPVEQHVVAAGTRLGGYVLGEPMGRGGMGVVYEATQSALSRRVAVKIVRAELAGDEVVRARFVREARALARMKHPYAVEVIDVGETDGVPYLVMERLEGESLAECLAREGALSLARACAVVVPVMAAVAAAHRAGVVHRDIKPQNVFLSRTPEGIEWPKVLDFGVARLLDEDDTVTTTGASVGTARYMSPEQLLGESAGPHSDQFSLAVVLYECLTGERPFSAATPAGLYAAISAGELRRPSALRPELPPGLDHALLRALRTHPAERHASVTALGRELLRHAPDALRRTWEQVFRDERSEHAPSDPAPDPGALTPPSSVSHDAPTAEAPATRQRRRAASWLAALLGVSAVTAALWFAFRRGPRPTVPSRVEAPVAPVASAPPVTVAPAPSPRSPLTAPVVLPATSAAPPRIVRAPPRPRALSPPESRDAGAASRPPPLPRGTNEMPY